MRRLHAWEASQTKVSLSDIHHTPQDKQYSISYEVFSYTLFLITIGIVTLLGNIINIATFIVSMDDFEPVVTIR